MPAPNPNHDQQPPTAKQSARIAESLPEFLERHHLLWEAQGLQRHVTDCSTLDAIAAIVRYSRDPRRLPERLPERAVRGRRAA